MSEKEFRNLVHQNYKKSRLIWFRAGLPIAVGILILIFGFLQSGMILPLLGSLMLYIGWQNFEHCRTAGQVYKSMKYLAERYEKHGSTLYDKHAA